MVLEEQHEKTESAAQWKVKRTPLVSADGAHPIALGTEGGNGSRLCQETATKTKSEELETERWEWGKGRGCSMLERRDRASAASVMYCDVPLSY